MIKKSALLPSGQKHLTAIVLQISIFSSTQKTTFPALGDSHYPSSEETDGLLYPGDSRKVLRTLGRRDKKKPRYALRETC